jgi:lipopolysaccharide export system protein LptC
MHLHNDGAMMQVITNQPVNAQAPHHLAWRAPWHKRFLNNATAYLPLLLMALLALGTWWLVKNTPVFENQKPAAAVRHEPDYAMTHFKVQRFDAKGVMRVQIEGDYMRHFPDTETLEIDNPRITEFAKDGRMSMVTAKQALANQDGSEVQLSGGARVLREATQTEAAIEFRGEFLHIFQHTEQVKSHLPVVVTQGGTEIRADSMSYDNVARVLNLKGRLRAVIAPSFGSKS